MADMNDVKNRLKNMLAVNEEKAAVAAEKSDHVVCVFRLDSFDDVEAVGEALKKNFLVLLDICRTAIRFRNSRISRFCFSKRSISCTIPM